MRAVLGHCRTREVPGHYGAILPQIGRGKILNISQQNLFKFEWERDAFLQVVVVYDITSERSFVNAREWLDNAVDGAGAAAMMLLGNKLDKAEDDLFRFSSTLQ